MSFFESLTQLPEDPIVHLPVAFAADPRPHKVNLGVGSYKDNEGLPLVLTCVRKAEASLPATQPGKEYQTIQGHTAFIQANIELVLGKGFTESFGGGLFAVQALGGTGALRVGGEFLAQETSKTIFIPTPTWPNHKMVFTRSGLKVHSYLYYSEKDHQFDFAGMCSDISNMPPGSIILLHAGCQNPTGIDPTFAQWQELSSLIKKQKIIPFFDLAYQGFVATPEEDAKVIRHFAAQGHEMLVANSFSKNLGLYGERMGGLIVLAQHADAARKIGSQIKQIIRGNYSSPPLHGAQIVAAILRNEALTAEWLAELADMRLRIKAMRETLVSGLQAKESTKDWSFIKRQNGFFSFLGLSHAQVQRLLKDYAIYLPADGRINVAGLNSHNMDYVIEALSAVNRP